MPGRVYAVASGKGGVGKTTTAVNLGVTLRADGHSVALVDGDLGMANLADFLGIEPEGTLHDILAGEAVTEDVITQIADGFAVLPGARDLEGFAQANPDALGDVIASLIDDYDFVIVDTGAGLSYEGVLPLGLVDEVILVTSPDPAAVGDTEKTVELAGLIDGEILGVVVTRVRDGDDPEAIAARLDADLLAAIPFDLSVQDSTAAGSPLEAHAPDSPAAEAYRGLEAALTDGEPPAADVIGSTPIEGTEGTESDRAEEPADDPDVGEDEEGSGDDEPAVDGDEEGKGADDPASDGDGEETGGDEPAIDEEDDAAPDADPDGADGEAEDDEDVAADAANGDGDPEETGSPGFFGRMFGWLR